MRLTDRIAVVTGAAGGPGGAVARAFAREGARLVLADTDDAKGEVIAEEITARSGKTRFVHCDVASRLDVRKLIARTLDLFDRIDIIVNAALLEAAGAALELKEDVFETALHAGLLGPFLLAQAAARQMASQGTDGAPAKPYLILNVARQPQRRGAAVSASFGGLMRLTGALAREFGPLGVRVNLLRVESTEGTDALDAIARAALFLASDVGADVTGQRLTPAGALALAGTPDGAP